MNPSLFVERDLAFHHSPSLEEKQTSKMFVSKGHVAGSVGRALTLDLGLVDSSLTLNVEITFKKRKSLKKKKCLFPMSQELQ